MRIVYEVGSYNERRYSKPWIAKVISWEIGKPAELEFGGNVGWDIAEIDANPGDLVRYGQKDRRNPKHTESLWGIVEDDGDIKQVSASYAREYWMKLIGEDNGR